MEEHPDSSSFMNASVPSNSVRMMVDSFRWCWWTDRGMNAGSCVCWRGLSDSCGSETQWDISGPPCTRLSGQDTVVTNKWCMARAWGLALTLSRLCFNSQLLQLTMISKNYFSSMPERGIKEAIIATMMESVDIATDCWIIWSLLVATTITVSMVHMMHMIIACAVVTLVVKPRNKSTNKNYVSCNSHIYLWYFLNKVCSSGQ